MEAAMAVEMGEAMPVATVAEAAVVQVPVPVVRAAVVAETEAAMAEETAGRRAAPPARLARVRSEPRPIL